MLGSDRLWMELYSVNRVAAVLHSHDLTVFGTVGAPRCDHEVFGKRRRFDDQRMVPHAGHGARNAVEQLVGFVDHRARLDRKSTRLNSSHGYISYAVFCL